MHRLTALLILAGVPVACVLQGAWLTAHAKLSSAGLRLAAALLAGLTTTLCLMGALNLVAPLAGWPLGVILAPALAASLHGQTRTGVFADVHAIFATPRGAAFGVGLGAFLVLLLWPAWSDAEIIYSEGTANHDAFFWILGADFAREHSCLASPGTPLASAGAAFNQAIAGWFPSWGRLGTESYLATVAGFAQQTPLTVYLWASGALFFAWVAAVYAVVRTFIADRLSWIALMALALFQPLFAFYHHNANLPNLLGVIAGATAVLATEWTRRAVAAGTQSPFAPVALFALGWQAVFCSYPEIAPFVGLPCALLALRDVRRERFARRVLLWLAGGFALGVLANPVVAERALRAFTRSLQMARFETNWANIVAAAGPEGFLPALLTLSTKTGHELGAVPGAIATALIVAGALLTWRRARDRYGVAALFAGAAALAVYTLATGFVYGWQKTAQFSGVFVAAIFPVGLVAALAQARGPAWRSWLATGVVAIFFGFSLTITQLDLLKWSGRKQLHAEWTRLDSLAPSAGEIVTIDAATFPQPFFYGMWSAYFLRAHSFVFAARGGAEASGYLRGSVRTEAATPTRGPILVSREWADAVVPATPRLAEGAEFALLVPAERILILDGAEPKFGVPRTVASRFQMRVRTIHQARLEIEIAAPGPGTPSGIWEARGANDAPRAFRWKGGRWHATLPLPANAEQTIECAYRPTDPAQAVPSTFPLSRLQLLRQPD